MLRFEIRVPRAQRSFRGELFDHFNDASNEWDNFIVIYVSDNNTLVTLLSYRSIPQALTLTY